jgi:hypothetical protein
MDISSRFSFNFKARSEELMPVVQKWFVILSWVLSSLSISGKYLKIISRDLAFDYFQNAINNANICSISSKTVGKTVTFPL